MRSMWKATVTVEQYTDSEFDEDDSEQYTDSEFDEDDSETITIPKSNLPLSDASSTVLRLSLTHCNNQTVMEQMYIYTSSKHCIS